MLDAVFLALESGVAFADCGFAQALTGFQGVEVLAVKAGEQHVHQDADLLFSDDCARYAPRRVVA